MFLYVDEYEGSMLSEMSRRKKDRMTEYYFKIIF